MTVEHKAPEKNQAKLTYLLIIASIVITVDAIGWTILNIVIKDWLHAAVDAMLMVLGYMAYWHSKHNNTKIIARMYFPLLFLMICILCLFFDVPNATVPRSDHHYFLPIVLYAYVLYQDEHPYLKIAVPIAISLAFLIFASTHIGINLSQMTTEQRLSLVWVNNSVALFMLFLGALILQSDFKVRHTLELELSKALLKNELKLY